MHNIWILFFCFTLALQARSQSNSNSLILELAQSDKLKIDSLSKHVPFILKTLSFDLGYYILECKNDSILGKIIYYLNSENIIYQENLLLFDTDRTSDPFYVQQWQFYQLFPSDNESILNIENAWQFTNDGLTYYGDEIVIAVVDSGINRNHEDLEQNIWYNINEIPNNNIDDDNNGFVDDYWGWNAQEHNDNVDINGIGNWHGTPVAGIIGARGNNGLGISGVNRSIKILNIVKGQDVASIIESYDYILNLRKLYNETNGEYGAFIVAINNSWGKEDQKAIYNQLWCSMYDALGKVGILSVVSAPNTNVNIDEINDMPSDCASEYIISVTNINSFDLKVLAAGYGKVKVDLGAPGFNSYTTSNTGEYDYFGGTSAAAPYVSGTIGLLYSVNSIQLNDDIIERPAIVAQKMREFILEGTAKINSLKNITSSDGRLDIMSSLNRLSDYYEIENNNVDSSSEFVVMDLYKESRIHRIFVEFNLLKPNNISYNLYNNSGELIDSDNLNEVPIGIHHIKLTEKELNPGLYIIHWRIGNSILNTKFLKLD